MARERHRAESAAAAAGEPGADADRRIPAPARRGPDALDKLLEAARHDLLAEASNYASNWLTEIESRRTTCRSCTARRMPAATRSSDRVRPAAPRGFPRPRGARRRAGGPRARGRRGGHRARPGRGERKWRPASGMRCSWRSPTRSAISSIGGCGAETRPDGQFGVELSGHDAQFLATKPAAGYFVAHQDGNTALTRDRTLARRVSIVIFLNQPRHRGRPARSRSPAATAGGGSFSMRRTEYRHTPGGGRRRRLAARVPLRATHE